MIMTKENRIVEKKDLITSGEYVKKRKEFFWGEVPKLINFEVLEKSIKIVSLNELLNLFPSMLEGKLVSKVLVDVNK